MHALLVSAFVALAPAPAPDSSGAAEPDADAAARVSDSEYIFVDGDDLQGDLLKPGGVPVRGSVGLKHESMISIRGQFIGELTQMALDM